MPYIKLFLFLVALAFNGVCLSAYAQSEKKLPNISVEPCDGLSGRGDSVALLLHVKVASAIELSLKGFVFDFFQTDFADVSRFDLYATDSVAVFDEKDLSNCRQKASLCDPTEPVTTFAFAETLRVGDNHFWLTCRISEAAREGYKIKAALQSMLTDTETLTIKGSPVCCIREIVLDRKVLFQPGDYGSANYRIPAIITASDGSLVTLSDRRKHNEGDLPQDIDVVCRRSIDYGKTWSEPMCIVKGQGVGKGFGDAALVRTDDFGGLMAVFCGGVGLWASTPETPLRLYYVLSGDNGKTWSEPIDFTSSVYGSECSDVVRRKWHGGFLASGNGLRLSSGRLMFVLTVRENQSVELSDYVIYTDDTGRTWQVSQLAARCADEAKLVDLSDGRLLMSIRHDSLRRYTISNDGGLTWPDSTMRWNDLTTTACNGDVIRYPLSEHPDSTGLLLQSLPCGAERSHVTVYASCDQGVTWPISRCVVPYASAYSSLCILPDGTIGLYVEEGEGGYNLVFYRFSLGWLMSGETENR